MIKERLQYFFDLIDQEYLFYYGGHFYWKFWHNTHSVCKELGEPRLAGTNCDGYRIIRSSIDAKMFYILEHHLVYAGFYGFRELVDGIGNRLEINHKNGITYDNFPKNLELVTPKQNTAHAIKTGLRKNVMGENSHCAKLTERKVWAIRHLLDEKEYSFANIGNMFSVSSVCISNINSNKTWRHL